MSVLIKTLVAMKALQCRLAILALVAWVLLPLRASFAERVFEPVEAPCAFITDSNYVTDSTYEANSTDEPNSTVNEQPFTSSLREPFTEEQDSAVVQASATSERSTGASSQKWDRVCRYFPRGMIPYVGARTPDDQKHRGLGIPLIGRGWRSQPFSISAFAGATDGDAFIRHRVHQQPSFYGGVNFGWDYDHYWGIEKRLGFGALNLTDGNYRSIADTGASITGEYRLMYYPLGDAKWRPFITAGVGWSDFYYQDDVGKTHLDTVGMIPFGGGLKYLYTERIALRIDLIDEFTFGTGALSDFHYVALTAGVEFRYGQRLVKMPWHRKG